MVYFGNAIVSATFLQIVPYFPFKLGEFVRHVNSSFSFKHFATKAKKTDRYDFMFFDFQFKTPVSIILYACLYLNSMICIDKYRQTQRKSENTVFSSTFINFCVVSYSGAVSIAVRSNHFLIVE